MMDLKPFDETAGPLVSSWAQSADEVLAWCSRSDAPVPAGVIAEWSDADGVEAFLLVDRGETIGYGEMWVDDDEEEVELARLIVAPAHRGRGVGRQLVARLVDLAHVHHHSVVMRVHPANVAAKRCYSAAGFVRVTAGEEADWNRGQPIAYHWMVLRDL